MIALCQASEAQGKGTCQSLGLEQSCTCICQHHARHCCRSQMSSPPAFHTDCSHSQNFWHQPVQPSSLSMYSKGGREIEQIFSCSDSFPSGKMHLEVIRVRRGRVQMRLIEMGRLQSKCGYKKLHCFIFALIGEFSSPISREPALI